MEEIIVRLKDDSKKNFLITLLNQFSFIDISVKNLKETKSSNNSIKDLFGIWKNKEINLKDVRKKAWGERFK